jgi:hypothetical protein
LCRRACRDGTPHVAARGGGGGYPRLLRGCGCSHHRLRHGAGWALQLARFGGVPSRCTGPRRQRRGLGPTQHADVARHRRANGHAAGDTTRRHRRRRRRQVDSISSAAPTKSRPTFRPPPPRRLCAPVGTVHAGARHLADRVEALHLGDSVERGRHATAHVVGGG